jgi:DNA-binding NarL/FixJ family response regulator
MTAGVERQAIVLHDRPTVRVGILDTLALTRDALRLVLDAASGFSVVGAAGDTVQAVNLVRALRPHVMLLDVGMPRLGGCDALRQLRDSGTGVPTVVLSDAMTGTEVVDALTIGARGFLQKDAPLRVLFECLRAVAEGHYWVGNERAGDAVDALRRVHDARRPAPAGATTRRGTPEDADIARTAPTPATSWLPRP